MTNEQIAELNQEAVTMIDNWCEDAAKDLDEYFPWEEAFDFIFVDYEHPKFIGLFHLPDGSQIFPGDVKKLREYASETLKMKFWEYVDAVQTPHPAMSAAERNRGLK